MDYTWHKEDRSELCEVWIGHRLDLHQEHCIVGMMSVAFVILQVTLLTVNSC